MTLSILPPDTDHTRRPLDHGVGSEKIDRATLEAEPGERAGDPT
ncbi:hypothetical protein [Natronobacterium lacisalsi]|nr:hypothetical protein [Halobiforma lacisalsi]